MSLIPDMYIRGCVRRFMAVGVSDFSEDKQL